MISADQHPVFAIQNALGIFNNAGEIVVGAGEANANIRILSYQTDFKYLWGLNKRKPLIEWVNTANDSTIVLIWDGMPPKEQSYPLNTSRYLTPLDWTVSFSLEIEKAVQSGDSRRYPALRIFIVELASQYNKQADSVRFFDQFHKRDVKTLPWVRIVSSLPRENSWNFSNLIANIVSNKTEPLHPWQLPTMQVCFSSKKKPDLDIIKRLWVSFITQPNIEGDHHTISNILGPIILANAGLKGDIHIQALQKLLTSINLIPNATTIAGYREKWGKAFEYYQKMMILGAKQLELVLVDDMAIAEGWGEVLCDLLKIKYKVNQNNIHNDLILIGSKQEEIELKIVASTNPSWLVERLKPGSDQRYRLNIGSLKTGGNNKDQQGPAQILFLDLRLFSGKSITEEQKFIESLLPLLEIFQSSEDEPRIAIPDGRTLPWPGFSPHEVKTMKEWVKNPKRETKDYFTALTLLPRIIALTDLSLPIVLFSSTGRREITQILEPYGSIITSFDKPKFMGAVDESIVIDTTHKFDTAYLQALEITLGRVLLSGLQKITPKRPVPALHKSNNDSGWRVEIFLDETGNLKENRKYTVGGVLIISPLGLDNWKDYTDQVIQNNFSDGIKRGGGKEYFKQNRINIIKALNHACNNKDIHIMALAFTYNSLGNEFQSVDAITDINTGDNVNRIVLNDLFESVIYIYLRHLLQGVRGKSKKIVVDIHCGARVIKRNKLTKAEFRILHEDWGHDIKKHGSGEDNVRVFSYDSVMPIVNKIVEKYSFSDFSVTYKTVRAFSLNMHGSNAPKDVRPIHYIADAIISGYHEQNYGLQHNDWWKKGIQVRDNLMLKSVIEANQYFLNGEYVNCLLSAGINMHHFNNGQASNNLIDSFRIDIKEAANRLDGLSFLSLCNKMDRGEGLNKTRGIVQGISEDGKFITISGKDYFLQARDWVDKHKQVGDRVVFNAFYGKGYEYIENVERMIDNSPKQYQGQITHKSKSNASVGIIDENIHSDQLINKQVQEQVVFNKEIYYDTSDRCWRFRAINVKSIVNKPEEPT